MFNGNSGKNLRRILDMFDGNSGKKQTNLDVIVADSSKVRKAP